jgi:hypothetical protein
MHCNGGLFTNGRGSGDSYSSIAAFPSWQPTKQLFAATTVYCNRIPFRVNEIDNPVWLVLEMIEIVCYFDGKQ